MNQFKEYSYKKFTTLDQVIDTLTDITNKRKDDISVIKSLPDNFIAGRKVNKIPTSSADVVPGIDLIGDISYNASFLYILINNAGTPVWRRAALGAF